MDARCKIRFSLNTPSLCSARRPWATAMAAFASKPAQVAVSPREAANSASQSEKSAIPYQRSGAVQRNASEKLALGSLAPQNLRQRHLADEEVTRKSSDVPLRLIDLESTLLGLRNPKLNDIQVAVKEIDLLAADMQPGAPIQEPTPVTGLEHAAREAERKNVFGTEPTTVVHAEVPIARRVLGATCTRSA
jgi:hypothetical protein